MSVSEAVEYIKIKTHNRQDTCARKFSETLMNVSPTLAFWQNVPPDLADLTSTQLTEVTELVRQTVCARHELDARTIGPWIYDVYAGSKKRDRYGNKWNDPYPYSYKGEFADIQLPLPLMKDFRANKKLMLAVCTAAIGELAPRKPKGQHKNTAFVNDAVDQVANKIIEDSSRRYSPQSIKDILRSYDDHTDWQPPITSIEFFSSADTESELERRYDYDVIVVIWSEGSRSQSSKIASLDDFARKVSERLN